jgi:cytochrome oxidase Cu insertion factor (SCO1/SenC/PrrC family)
MNASLSRARGRGLTPLWAMIAVFAAPVIAAWFFYLNPELLPSGRSNRGELIEPVVPLFAEIDFWNPQGEPFDSSTLAGKWTLLYLANGHCGEDCRGRLLDMRQIRLALGESRFSVERLLVVNGGDVADPVDTLSGEHGGPRVALTDADGRARLRELLAAGDHGFHGLYILDPMGNLMMRYAPQAPAKDTLKDMERLLKASKNWIKGAQYGHK